MWPDGLLHAYIPMIPDGKIMPPTCHACPGTRRGKQMCRSCSVKTSTLDKKRKVVGDDYRWYVEVAVVICRLTGEPFACCFRTARVW